MPVKKFKDVRKQSYVLEEIYNGKYLGNVGMSEYFKKLVEMAGYLPNAMQDGELAKQLLQ